MGCKLKIKISDFCYFLKVVYLEISYVQKENQSSHPYIQKVKLKIDIVTSSEES